jgi:nucleoside 2-deoxyribosyltransferase
MRIYYAAPLHNLEDRERNEDFVKLLREKGHKVFLPQENGVWDQMVNERMEKGESQEEAVYSVRQMLYVENTTAIQNCQCVFAYFGDREPSEGGLWEMGYAHAKGKYVVLYNPHNWRFNLMPEFGSVMFTDKDKAIDRLYEISAYIEGAMKGEFR